MNAMSFENLIDIVRARMLSERAVHAAMIGDASIAAFLSTKVVWC